jgi:hypothetical protein
MTNPRLSPIVAELDTLPKDMLLVIAAIDILAHEQLTFVERVTKEIEERGGESVTGRRVVARVFEKGLHGWITRKALLASAFAFAFTFACLERVSLLM